ncbi:MAG: replication factor C large subunit [Euryarchaeota archaeon]|nr:replication factor C large subunit [Euryarchaeota archaeon]
MDADWTEKYRPRALKDIVGNASALERLRRWGESWSNGAPEKRGVILAGPPGVGKTSAAHALAFEFGWEVIELNASDQRNAGAIKSIAHRGAIFEGFSHTGEFRRARDGGRKLIILDEADNIFGREDAGGARAIVQMLRETMQPVILIANDYQKLKQKSGEIVSSCITLYFDLPSEFQVSRLLSDIAGKEGMKATEGFFGMLASQCGGDVRSAVNDLQSFSKGGKNVLEEKDIASIGYRDVQIEPEIFVRNLFAARNMGEARRAYREFDGTPDEAMLWLDGNMTAGMSGAEDLSKGYAMLSSADLFLGRANRAKIYSLWPYAIDMMTCGIAVSRKSRAVGAEFKLPFWLIMMSRSKASRGVRNGLCMKLARYTHTSSSAIASQDLAYYSRMLEDDQELRGHMAAALYLTEAEVGYLLRERTDSERVAQVMAEVRALEEKGRKGTGALQVQGGPGAG